MIPSLTLRRLRHGAICHFDAITAHMRHAYVFCAIAIAAPYTYSRYFSRRYIMPISLPLFSSMAPYAADAIIDYFHTICGCHVMLYVYFAYLMSPYSAIITFVTRRHIISSLAASLPHIIFFTSFRCYAIYIYHYLPLPSIYIQDITLPP